MEGWGAEFKPVMDEIESFALEVFYDPAYKDRLEERPKAPQDVKHVSWNLSQAVWYHTKLIQQCDRAYRTSAQPTSQLNHVTTMGENRITDNFHRTHREEGCVNYYRVRFDRRDDLFDAACRCQVAAEGDEGFEPSWMFDRLTSYGARGGVVSMACGIIKQLYMAWIGSLWLLRRLREYIDTLGEREKMYIVTLQTMDQARSLVHRFLDALPAHSLEKGDHFGAVDMIRVRTALKRRYALLHAAYSAFDTLEATVKAHVEQRDAKHFQLLRDQEDAFAMVLKWMRPGSLAALRQTDKAFCADARVANRLPKMNPRKVVGYFPHEMQGSKLIVYQRKLVRLYVDFQAPRTRDRPLKPGEAAPERLEESGPKKMVLAEIKRVYSHLTEQAIRSLMMQDSQRRTKWEQARGPDPKFDDEEEWQSLNWGLFFKSAPKCTIRLVYAATKQPITTVTRARGLEFSGHFKSLATGSTFSAPGRMRELPGAERDVQRLPARVEFYVPELSSAHGDAAFCLHVQAEATCTDARCWANPLLSTVQLEGYSEPFFVHSKKRKK